MRFTKMLMLAAVVTVACGQFDSAIAGSIQVEAYKDNNVATVVGGVDYSDIPNPFSNDPTYGPNLNGWSLGLSYIAFDISSIPAGAVITDAAFSVYDLRVNWNQFIKVELLDVPADWDESTLTLNEAVVNYGAVKTGGTVNTDPSALLWRGDLLLYSDDPPGPSEIFAQDDPFSGTSEQDLIDALNAELTTGDGQVVMVLRGVVGTNNYTASRENLTFPGPNLYVSYVPEPASMILAALGCVTAVLWRRQLLS